MRKTTIAAAAVLAVVVSAWLVKIMTTPRGPAPVMMISPSQAGAMEYVSHGDQPRMLRLSCVNNLKQIELCMRIWGGDHNYQFPWNVGTNSGGTKELCTPDKDGFDANSFRDFQVMSNELGSPKVLVCTSDTQKKSAENFTSIAALNVTYRVHIVPGLGLDSTNKIPLIVCPADGSILYYDGSIKTGNPNEPNDEPAK